MLPLERILLVVSLVLYGFLAVFSYAYVDLNLTLSQNPPVVQFVQTMQQLGYFQRPTATLIYLLFIIFTSSFFIFNLWLFYKSKVGWSYLKISTITNTIILIFAYPFLSSDLFNYLFDAKIILNYHVSPYTHRPLDFPNDEWLRFMRWIHRYSPYGPLWLGMSLIPAALGFSKFILNFLTFKIFIGVFHLINTYLIFKILQVTANLHLGGVKAHLRGGRMDSSEVFPRVVLFGTAFYALNPLFLIEGVANAHNDMVLASFMLLSVYLLTIGKNLWSYLSIFAGALVKYIPILILPWLIFLYLRDEKILHLPGVIKYVGGILLIMTVFTYLFSSFRVTVPFVSSGATQVQFQPWYLFWTLPLVALIPKIWLIAVSIAISIGAALRYLPYLYYGDWSQPGTISFMQAVTIVPALVATAAILLRYVIKVKKN